MLQRNFVQKKNIYKITNEAFRRTLEASKNSKLNIVYMFVSIEFDSVPFTVKNISIIQTDVQMYLFLCNFSIFNFTALVSSIF